MKLIIICLLITFSTFSEASIYIKGSHLSHENFLALVQEKKGITIKDWLHNNELERNNLDTLIVSGKRLLSQTISLQEFYDLANKDRESAVMTYDWRQAFVDILVKWLAQNNNESPAIWEDICYFYHLDSEISRQNVELHSKCKNTKQLFFIKKPADYQNELVTIDGVLWKNSINFYKRKQSRLISQIKIYSDEYLPVTEYRSDLSLGKFERLEFAVGNCHNVKSNIHHLNGYDLPVHQVFILNENNCIDPLVLPLADSSPRFWDKNKKWFILGGILLGGLVLSQTRDKEISFEFPF